jgi:hypothetical protein
MNNRDYPTGADGESPPWRDDTQYRSCPHCEGTGKLCEGCDEIICCCEEPQTPIIFYDCPKCEGSGEVEITQEDIDDEKGYYDERI